MYSYQLYIWKHIWMQQTFLDSYSTFLPPVRNNLNVITLHPSYLYNADQTQELINFLFDEFI